MIIFANDHKNIHADYKEPGVCGYLMAVLW